MLPKVETILELYEGHPERWQQEYTYSNEDNVKCARTEATKCCLIGALFIVYSHPNEAIKRIADEIKQPISFFNDTHTFDEIMELVRKVGV